LEVRRIYSKFWNSVRCGGEPDDGQLKACFRGAGTQIATVIGRDEYRDLRVHDRLQIRKIQEQILAWLRNGGSDAQVGRRLWQDLSGVAQMLMQVNRRQDLVDHDSNLLKEAWGLLFNKEPAPPAIPKELFERLKKLLGLDEEVDQLIRGERVDTEVWRQPLERLNKKFSTVGSMGADGGGFTGQFE